MYVIILSEEKQRKIMQYDFKFNWKMVSHKQKRLEDKCIKLNTNSICFGRWYHCDSSVLYKF